MKSVLLDLLICPACLPDENRLQSHIFEAQGDDIVAGKLACGACGRTYPVREGIGFLTPSAEAGQGPAVAKYESAQALSSYIWSHYGDVFKAPDATDAYRRWSDLVTPHSGPALDAGAAVGRFTFEMSRKSDLAVGIDNSVQFVRSARELMLKRCLPFALAQEGLLTAAETVRLPATYDSAKVEFIVADAQALPFRSGAFASLASLNLVDKLPRPLKHLQEINRVACKKNVQFLFSDPFSWSADVARTQDWLGGTPDGPYAGAGIENIKALLDGRLDGLAPPWRIAEHGHQWWKIRNHANHYELIRSWFVKACR